MEQEKSKDYSFIHYNCIISAKRCLLAGISPKLKKSLKDEAGFSNKFFQVEKIETCNSFYKWVVKLEQGLMDLNISATAKDTPIHTYHEPGFTL